MEAVEIFAVKSTCAIRHCTTLSVARASGKVLTVSSDESPHGTTAAENYPHADKVGTPGIRSTSKISEQTRNSLIKYTCIAILCMPVNLIRNQNCMLLQ